MKDDRLIALRPGLTILPGDETGDSTGLLLLLNYRIVLLRGRGGRRLLQALDRPRTLDDLCERLHAKSRREVVAAVDLLDQHGLLEPLADGDLPPYARALTDLGVDGAAVSAVVAAVEGARIRVIGDGLLGEAMMEALQQYGVRPEKAAAPRDIADFAEPDASDVANAASAAGAADATEVTLVALDTEQPQVLDAINAWALCVRAPWMLLSVGGFVARVGPLFVPRETACYACYRARLDGNVSSYDRYMRVMAPIRAGRVGRAPADDLDPTIAAIAAGLAALEIMLFFAARVSGAAVKPSLHGAFADYSLLTHTTTVHRVLKLPRCPACGTEAWGHPTIRAWMEPSDRR
jgi:ribosomal protein S12 methylthiotransferase accessory factor